MAIVETFVIEGDPEIPVMEFYETGELNGQFDNWIGPTANCVLAMCRAAGFARVELLARDRTNLLTACFRRWEAEPEAPGQEPPKLESATNAQDHGINFLSTRDNYLTCWFRTSAPRLSTDDLRCEIGGFGAPAVLLRDCEGGLWQANFRVPPGTPGGWNDVRLRLKTSRFGSALRIAVDLPPATDRLLLRGVCDAETSRPNQGGGI